MINRAVWKRQWGFKDSEVDALIPIVRQLALDFESRSIPSLDRTLEISAAQLGRRRFHRYRELLKKKLDAFGLSIPYLHTQIQPAALFREIWLYQFLRREGAADKKELKYLPLKKAVAELSPAGTQFERKARAYLLRALDDANLLDGFLLPDRAFAWSKRQKAIIKKYAGPRTLTGEELWADATKNYLVPRASYLKRSYGEHKSRYWRHAMGILARELLSKAEREDSKNRNGRNSLSKRDAYSTAYYFLNFLFPQTFEAHLSRKKAAELVRVRLLPPKSLRPKKSPK